MGRKTLSAFSIRGNYYIVPLKCVYRQWFLVRGLVDGSGQHTFLQESLKAGVCVPFVVAIRLNMLVYVVWLPFGWKWRPGAASPIPLTKELLRGTAARL